MSQLMGAIVLQSVPAGQHIADLLSLKAMHVWLDEQQKFEGKPPVLHDVKPLMEHDALGNMSKSAS